MLSYRLPSFLNFLSHHYKNLYSRYAGRLTELFPSSAHDDSNLVIVHDAADTLAEDDQIIQLWKEFEEE